MSKSEKEAQDTTTIDGILRGLTNRPNVQATLVLSRKDGSIIRATGFKIVAAENNGLNASDRAVSPSGEETRQENAVSETQPAGSADRRPSSSRSVPSPANILAASIYTFVNHAVSLSSAMSLPGDTTAADSYGASKSSSDTQTKSRSPSQSQSHGQGRDFAIRGADGSRIDEDIQLLRMRTRRQEIIIFPDPKYLCCVVQNISKAGNAENQR